MQPGLVRLVVRQNCYWWPLKLGEVDVAASRAAWHTVVHSSFQWLVAGWPAAFPFPAPSTSPACCACFNNHHHSFHFTSKSPSSNCRSRVDPRPRPSPSLVSPFRRRARAASIIPRSLSNNDVHRTTVQLRPSLDSPSFPCYPLGDAGLSIFKDTISAATLESSQYCD